MTRSVSLWIGAICWLLAAGSNSACAQQQAMPASSIVQGETPADPFPPIAPPQIISFRQTESPNAAMMPDAPTQVPFNLGAEAWTWQFLPEGLVYKPYLAGGRESRLATHFVHVRSGDWMWDPTIGGHVGVLRYGSESPLWPEGWQLDAEGAAFPRIRLDADHTLVSTDLRCGFPLTWRRGPLEAKFGYYHLSSHLGDEWMASHQSLQRLNYTRDSLVWGIGFRPIPLLRLYGEADWSFANDGGSEPWHFQFGADVSPVEPNQRFPYPFLAVNTALREEVDFSGNLTVQAGLQWRSQAGRLLRLGVQYFNGLSDQAQFFRQFEEQIGFGVWYDY